MPCHTQSPPAPQGPIAAEGQSQKLAPKHKRVPSKWPAAEPCGSPLCSTTRYLGSVGCAAWEQKARGLGYDGSIGRGQQQAWWGASSEERPPPIESHTPTATCEPAGSPNSAPLQHWDDVVGPRLEMAQVCAFVRRVHGYPIKRPALHNMAVTLESLAGTWASECRHHDQVRVFDCRHRAKGCAVCVRAHRTIWQLLAKALLLNGCLCILVCPKHRSLRSIREPFDAACSQILLGRIIGGAWGEHSRRAPPTVRERIRRRRRQAGVIPAVAIAADRGRLKVREAEHLAD